jgi:hypothetical protein
MAGPAWWEENDGLRGLFGSIVSSVSQGASTAEVWQNLRDAATSQAIAHFDVVGTGDETDADVENAASALLKGVGVIQVSQARSAASQIVNAQATLMSLEPNDPISYEALGKPPWAQTINAPGVQTQYRIRVLRDVTFKGINTVNRQEWATYNLTGPLTTTADALAQADQLFANSGYNKQVSINAHLSYSIEAI